MSIELKEPQPPLRPTPESLISTKYFKYVSLTLDNLNKEIQKIHEELIHCFDVKILLRGKPPYCNNSYARDEETIYIEVRYVDQTKRERYQKYNDDLVEYYEKMIAYEKQLAEYKIQALRKKMEAL